MSRGVGTLVNGGLAVIDSLDLFIAVIGIVAAIVGSSAPLWLALSKKADKEDFARLWARMDTRLHALEAGMDGKLEALHAGLDGKLDALEVRMDTRLDALESRVDGKFDALILRLVPGQLPPPGELGAGRG